MFSLRWPAVTTPAKHDRMAGAYCKPWCIYCRRAPGLDCTDTARPTKWRRRIDKENLRRYVDREMEGEMSWRVPPITAERRKLAEEQGYDATIRPWMHGWEILGIRGPGIEDGTTQACTIDEVEYMIRDYVATWLELFPDDDGGTDEWDMDSIPVRLTLSLEHGRHTDTRTASLDMALNGEPVTIVEQITWWREAPEAE